MSSFVMPAEAEISSLLAIIFGDGLGVKGAEPANLADQYTATFVNDEDKLVAVCVCDKAFVAYSGAALSMIPVDVANEMLSGGSITDALVGNFFEVMNICSKLMMSDSSAHLRLSATLDPGTGGDALASLQEHGSPKGFAIDIPRYGIGHLSFLTS